MTRLAADIDPYIALYPLNSDGSIGAVARFDDDGVGGGSLNSRFEFTATTAGYYELRTTHFGATAGGSYTLTVTTTPVSIFAPEGASSMLMKSPSPLP
jgi:hypothetical protein